MSANTSTSTAGRKYMIKPELFGMTRTEFYNFISTTNNPIRNDEDFKQFLIRDGNIVGVLNEPSKEKFLMDAHKKNT